MRALRSFPERCPPMRFYRVMPFDLWVGTNIHLCSASVDDVTTEGCPLSGKSSILVDGVEMSPQVSSK